MFSAFVRGCTRVIAADRGYPVAVAIHVGGAVVTTAVAFRSIDARYIAAQSEISKTLLRERLSYHEKEALLRKKQENVNLSLMAYVVIGTANLAFVEVWPVTLVLVGMLELSTILVNRSDKKMAQGSQEVP